MLVFRYSRFLLLLILDLLAIDVTAQDDFYRQFDAFSKSIVNEFDDFRDRANREYAGFLLTSWKQFESFPAVERPQEKEVPPVIFEGGRDIKNKPSPQPIKSVIDCPSDEPAPQPVSPVRSPQGETASFVFRYYGEDLSIRIPIGEKFSLASLVEEDISKGWETLSGGRYESTLSDCLAIRSEKGLCDWAYLTLLETFSNAWLGKGNSATMLASFLFLQSGYRMRLGVADEHLYLLFGTEYIVYGQPYFDNSECRYYALGENTIPQRMMIADIPFPGEESLSFIIVQEQSIGAGDEKLKAFHSKRYSLNSVCSVDKERIRFYGKYPSVQYGDDFMTRWAVCANAPMAEGVKGSMYSELKRIVDGKRGAEAVDILLDFVQTAFEYKRDDEIWGGDRAFFAEETLYYPYCDCEDRAILFSRLVRDLLGLDVVLVYYPGHLATAVKFPDGAHGDFISLPDGEFTVCDPTYIGAGIGATMPGMDNEDATVLLL